MRFGGVKGAPSVYKLLMDYYVKILRVPRELRKLRENRTVILFKK